MTQEMSIVKIKDDMLAVIILVLAMFLVYYTLLRLNGMTLNDLF